MFRHVSSIFVPLDGVNQNLYWNDLKAQVSSKLLLEPFKYAKLKYYLNMKAKKANCLF